MSAPRAEAVAEPSRILELLERCFVITLACHDDQGCWAAPVFYAHRDFELFFTSSPASRHARALGFDAHVAGAVHGPADDWSAIVGLQVSGVARALSPAEADVARDVYGRRFPFVASDPRLAAALRSSGWYGLVLDEVALTDNARGFGQRARWRRDAA